MSASDDGASNVATLRVRNVVTGEIIQTLTVQSDRDHGDDATLTIVTIVMIVTSHDILVDLSSRLRTENL